MPASVNAWAQGVYGKFPAVRHFRSNPKQVGILLVIVLSLAFSWISQRNGGESPPVSQAPRETASPASLPEAPDNPSRADFDFYLLTLTSHPAFCADGHERKTECRAPVPLSIHGLWPEKLQPGKYPRDCAGPRLDLEPGLERELRLLMPGMAEGLHQHEWRKHGRCTGLGDDDYFRHTLDAARILQAALADELASRAGKEIRAQELRDIANAYAPGLGATLTFHCRTLKNASREHRREPHLLEIRQCLDDDGASGAPGTPLDCASVQRRDQGCGGRFRIAETTR